MSQVPRGDSGFLNQGQKILRLSATEPASLTMISFRATPNKNIVCMMVPPLRRGAL
jgi:hypothetical protein